MRNCTVDLGGIRYDVERWLPGMPVIESYNIAMDTETELIEEGKTPPLVMIQACSHRLRKVQWVMWDVADQYMREMFDANPDSEWIFHNAPFDLRVLGGVRQTPEWLRAVKEDRVIDTGIRYIMHRLDTGQMLNKWGLDAAAKEILKVKLSKDESIRLTFKRGMDVTAAHVKYAVLDAIATAQLREMMPHRFPTEEIHVKGYIALDDIGMNGFLVDMEEMVKVREKFQQERDENQAVLSLWGWWPGKKGGNGVIQRILGDIEEHLSGHFEDEVKLTRTEKTKDIQMSDESLAIIEEATSMITGAPREHPFIRAHKESEHCGKMIGTYLKESLVGEDGRVHPNFSPLVKTGRTSCSRPNIQNIPRKGGIRGIYVAKPGHVLFACDYVQAELCSLAETCFLRYGNSVMRDVINSGEDLHQWFGDQIMKASGGDPNDGKDYRQMAKPCNFGFPGGLGTAKFQKFARGYGVDFTREQCSDLKDLWLEAFPEMKGHLKPEEDEKFTIRERYTDEEGVLHRINEAKYIARTVNGRRRRNATYCSACNYSFQGLVADGAKIALWYLYQAGFCTVNFIHDEAIVELPLNDSLQQNVHSISYLMKLGMEEVIKHVAIRTDGALMRRWYKEAKGIRDENNNLLIWEPDL